jgi:hypothetical protein
LFDKTTPTLETAASGGGEQIDYFLDRGVGTMIGRLKTTVRPALGVGLMVEATVGEGSAQSFVKRGIGEQPRHLWS